MRNRELDVLYVVSKSDGATTSEVAGNILVGYASAYSALHRLERSGLVNRNYTGRSYSANGYGWAITPAGTAELEKHDDDD